MALPHTFVVQEFPPEWNVSLDADNDRVESLPEKPPLNRIVTAATTSEDEHPLEIVGSTKIYDDEGNIRLIPVCLRNFIVNYQLTKKTPSPDPKGSL